MDDKLQKIIAAIKGLKPEDFTGSGAPKVDALSKALGFDVTGAERDEAWSAVQAEKASSASASAPAAPVQKAEKASAVVTGEDVLKNLRARGVKV